MIFPTDYRERLIKQEKSRQYKAMLDQQIRQNNLYNQDSKLPKRNQRIRTEPAEPYLLRDRSSAPVRQLQHESTFLPTISSPNIIDHTFKYLSSPDNSSRKYFSNLSAKKSNLRRQNDEDLDDHLDRCLQECDQLINGISKNFINLNNHLRNKSQKLRGYDFKNQRLRNYSTDFDLYNKGQDSRISRGLDNLPVTSLRSSQLFGMDSDVGRNEMMNYNIQKAREKEILHISTPGDNSYNFGDKDIFDLQKSSSRIKRKNINDIIDSKVKTTPNRSNNGINFDTINSPKSQNQFTNVDLPQSMSSQLNQSIQKMKMETKRMADEMKAHEQMKKKDNKILEHLRKAKNKGSILFKKIQVFRKQRQDLQNTNSQTNQQSKAADANKSKAASRNTQKSPIESRNSYVSQTNNLESDIKKEEINVDSNGKKDPSQLNSRANSKVSQK